MRGWRVALHVVLRRIRRAPMNSGSLPILRYLAVTLIVCCFAGPCFAQQLFPDSPQPSIETTSSAAAMPAAPTPVMPVITQQAPSSIQEHRFWDRANVVLFASSAALSAADFAVTRQNLQSGGRELNPVVRVFGRSTPALALNFAGETVGGIGLSYFFHKKGHHHLERMVSAFNIATSAGAVAYGVTHR